MCYINSTLVGIKFNLVNNNHLISLLNCELFTVIYLMIYPMENAVTAADEYRMTGFLSIEK